MSIYKYLHTTTSVTSTVGSSTHVSLVFIILYTSRVMGLFKNGALLLGIMCIWQCEVWYLVMQWTDQSPYLEAVTVIPNTLTCKASQDHQPCASLIPHNCIKDLCALFLTTKWIRVFSNPHAIKDNMLFITYIEYVVKRNG